MEEKMFDKITNDTFDSSETVEQPEIVAENSAEVGEIQDLMAEVDEIVDEPAKEDIDSEAQEIIDSIDSETVSEYYAEEVSEDKPEPEIVVHETEQKSFAAFNPTEEQSDKAKTGFFEFFRTTTWKRTWDKITTALLILVMATPIAILAYILIWFLMK